MPTDSLKIIANGYVLTCDPRNRGGRYNLLIRDGRVIEISDSLDLFTSLHPYATVIDATGKLIIPGFVNAHVHSESILLRERTEDLHFGMWKRDIRLDDCVRTLLDPAQAEDVLSVYVAAYFSHLKAGTTLVGEFGPPVNEQSFVALLQAIDRSDVKSVVVLQNWDQIRYARELGPKRPQCMVSLGSEEDYTVYSFENAVRAAKDLNVPLVAHIAEQREGVEVVKKNFQKNIVSVISTFHALQPTTLVVHGNHLSEQEVEVIERMSLSPVLCARSAMYKQTGYPSLRYLASGSVRLCMGTDWGNLDMIKEMQFVDQLPLLISSVRQFSPLELVRMATINGAHALGLASDTGSIETGKKADLTFLTVGDLRLPVLSPYATAHELAKFLIRNLSTHDISDVMIDGEFYVNNSRIVTVAEEDIIEGFRKTWDKFFPMPPPIKPGRLAAETQPAETSFQPKPKIIPFVSLGRTEPSQPDGFEEGFTIVEKRPVEVDAEKRSINLEAPTSSGARVDRLNAKPELSKEVKRIFGEDEEL